MRHPGLTPRSTLCDYVAAAFLSDCRDGHLDLTKAQWHQLLAILYAAGAYLDAILDRPRLRFCGTPVLVLPEGCR